MGTDLKVGLDFDNTIVCYDEALAAALDAKNLPIDPNKGAKKTLQNCYYQQWGGNLKWSYFQGELYGRLIQKAKPYPFIKEFLRHLTLAGIPFCIISHKTHYPAVGKRYDFHNAAVTWLSRNGFFDDLSIGLSAQNCFWETTKEDKLRRIEKEGCTHFFDDLAVLLKDEGFPKSTHGILFNDQSDELPFVLSWRDAFDKVQEWMPKPSLRLEANYSVTPIVEDSLGAFKNLLKENLGEVFDSWEPIRGGGNNRLYKIKTKLGYVYVGKQYFRSKNDPRDRLGHEWRFSELIFTYSIAPVPRPLAKDDQAGVALYEYVEGDNFFNVSHSHDLPDDFWIQCIDFLKNIQSTRSYAGSRGIPDASHSAFSLAEHLGIVQQQRDNWLRLITSNIVSPKIRELVENVLEPAYQRLAEKFIDHPYFKKSLSAEARILSPSDFGLHNTILNKRGRLVFLDFEYAGWDDPAKTVVDFFCQPRVKAPPSFRKKLFDEVLGILPETEKAWFEERLPLVDSCIRLKWCYIFLNSLHPNHKKRREFAGNVHFEQSEVGIVTLVEGILEVLDMPQSL